MKLNQFNGGLSTRLAPQLLQINEAVEYENINNESGNLIPVKDKTDVSIAVAKYCHYFIAKSEWVSSSAYRDYLEYQEKLYYTEVGSYPRKYNGIVEQRLGIIKPIAAPLVTDIIAAPFPVTSTSLIQTATGTIDAQEDNGAQRELKYYFVNNNTNNLLSTIVEDSITLTGSTSTVSISITVNGRVNETKVYRLHYGLIRYVGTITSGSPTLVDTTLDISTNDEYQVTGLTGTYQYVLTYYNSTDGTESMPSELTSELIFAGDVCKLTNVPISPDSQVDKRRVYRIGGNLTDFTLVTEIDNIVTTYDDYIIDSEVDGRILESTYYNEAPDELKYLTEAHGVFFGALGDKLRFTPTGKSNAWPSVNYIDFEADITGIGIVANGVIVCTKFKSWIVVGTSATTFIPYPLGGDQGCISHQSIQQLKGAILWASTDGICTTSGNEVVVISKKQLGKLELTVENAVIHDEVYYLHQTNGKTLAFDTSYGSVYKQLDLNISRIIKADDVLYGFEVDKLYSLFSNTSKLSLTYLSPLFVDNGYSERKTYKTMYLRSEGIIVVEIFLDGASVGTTIYTTTDTHEVTMLQDEQDAYSLQFRITGTGTVFELEYKTMGRQNGR